MTKVPAVMAEGMTKEEQMMISSLADRLLTVFIKSADHMVVKDLKHLAKLAAYVVVKERRHNDL